MPRTRVIPALLFAALFLTLAPTPVALAQPEQSPAELRAENDRLREEIERLRGELADRDAEIERKDRLIEQLRDAVRKARNAGSSGGSPAPSDAAPEEDTPTREEAPIPSEPFASPDSMFADLLDQYSERFTNVDTGDTRARQEYLRDLRGWARDAGRSATGPVEWRVRVIEIEQPQGSAVNASVEMIDASSGLPFGAPFTIRATGRNATRIRDAGDGAEWILDGVLRSEIEIDESVADVESAGEKAYIGPFAIYTFEVAVRALRDA